MVKLSARVEARVLTFDFEQKRLAASSAHLPVCVAD